MEETIIVDGRQFILTTDYPLTAEQKEQTMTEIRRQSGCGCGNEMEHIGEITSLATGCASVTMLAAANITVQNILIGTVNCGTGPACPSSIICTSTDCTPPDSVTIVVTWANSGDTSGTFTPTLTVTPTVGPTVPYTGSSTTVLGSPDGGVTPGSATTEFTTVVLPRGTNNVCVDSGTIT